MSAFQKGLGSEAGSAFQGGIELSKCAGSSESEKHARQSNSAGGKIKQSAT
jgi:hypothetical protein